MTPSRRFQLEVVCETVADAHAALDGGADRIELCSALDLGGLTPSAGLFDAVRAAVRLPVWVMIRPRAGDFVYSPSELDVMRRDMEHLRGSKPAGLVFGVLSPNGRVNSEACRSLLAACGDTPAVFHRAFDRTPDALEALRMLIDLGFHRLLTSGREGTALDGAKAIAQVREVAGKRIEVLPCGKVRAENIGSLLSATGCDQVHGSFADEVPVADGAGFRGYPLRTSVSRMKVEAARKELDRLAVSLSSLT